MANARNAIPLTMSGLFDKAVVARRLTELAATLGAREVSQSEGGIHIKRNVLDDGSIQYSLEGTLTFVVTPVVIIKKLDGAK